MACSAVTLSFATITAVVAVACLAISFGTDNWYEIRVNRTYIEEREPVSSQKEFDEDVRYFSRDVGLFRMCFPEAEKPKKGKNSFENLLLRIIFRTISIRIFF